MKAHFKKQFCIQGKLYKPGMQELPDALTDQWFVKAQIKKGHIVLLELPKEEDAEMPGPVQAFLPDPELPQSKKKKK